MERLERLFIREFKKKPALSWQGNIDQFSTPFLEFLNDELKVVEHRKEFHE